MRPITDRLKDGEWAGRRVFVVGSGPSLKGFDFAVLKDELTIGVNHEYVWGPTIALCQDPRIYKGDGSPEYPPLRDNPRWNVGPHIPVYFKGHPHREDFGGPDTVYQATSAHSQKTPFRWGTSLKTGLFYGANVGMSAINLAEILGARCIYLLGFDADPTDLKTHHHDAYPKEWTPQEDDAKYSIYGQWQTMFMRIASMSKTVIVNLNPESAIAAFPKDCPINTFMSFRRGEELAFEVTQIWRAFRGTPHIQQYHEGPHCRFGDDEP